jgi:YhcH/YjgK/YiaL family protein
MEARMVIDVIENAELYYGLSRGIADGLQWLQHTDLDALALGRHELSGGCYAIVQDYGTKPMDQANYEAHRKYVDIQYIAKGAEAMGWANLNDLSPDTGYDDSKDVLFLNGRGSYFTAPTGTFVIFYPEDAHAPALTPATPNGDVRKVVVKVPV